MAVALVQSPGVQSHIIAPWKCQWLVTLGVSQVCNIPQLRLRYPFALELTVMDMEKIRKNVPGTGVNIIEINNINKPCGFH